MITCCRCVPSFSGFFPRGISGVLAVSAERKHDIAVNGYVQCVVKAGRGKDKRGRTNGYIKQNRIRREQDRKEKKKTEETRKQVQEEMN